MTSKTIAGDATTKGVGGWGLGVSSEPTPNPQPLTPSQHHIVPLRVYFAIFTALMVLTAVTVVASGIDLGALNTPVALGIAVTKATLVILYFMHVRYSSKLTWLVVISGFSFLAIMIVFIIIDPLTRGWLGS